MGDLPKVPEGEAPKVEGIQQESPKEEAGAQTPQEPQGDEDTQRKRVDELLDEGYTPLQIEKKWGFSHATVWRVSHKRIAPEAAAKGDSPEETATLPVNMPMVDIPMVLKAGQGEETISPEGLLRHYFLSDGDPGVWMFRGMMLLRAAQLMNLTDVEIMKGQADAQAKAIKPILDVMETARKDMDAAAQRAKESNMEIAEAAAMGAAGGLLGRIDARFEELKQKKADIATVQNPMQGLMARTMETVMNQLTSKLLGQPAAVPGMVDERGKAGTAGMTSTGGVPGMVDERGGK